MASLRLLTALLLLPPSATKTVDQLSAADLYDTNQAEAFAALSKLSYCGPGPLLLAPWAIPDVMPGLVTAGCGSACRKANFRVDKVELISQGRDREDYTLVTKLASTRLEQSAPAECLVVFRGPATTKWRSGPEWNTQGFKTKSCREGCKVVSGLLKMYQELEPSVVRALRSVGCPPGSSLALTGHSLGGALASIAMFFLQDNLGYEISLSYTFEQPKPFNKRAVQVFEHLFKRPVSFFQVTNQNDMKTVFPLDQSLPFDRTLYHPGFQVWYTGYGVEQFQLCGNSLSAPACGVLSLPPNQQTLEQCDSGGMACRDDPHCHHALAPATNFCEKSNEEESDFLKCMLGLPMSLPPAHEAAPLLAVPAASGGSDRPAQECFREDTMAMPQGMLGRTVSSVPDIHACQTRCRETAYCEMFTYREEMKSCDLSGGWANYLPGIAGATAGPKDCSLKPPKLDLAQSFKLQQEYAHFMGAFELGPDFNPEGKRSFSAGQMVCCALLSAVLGAVLTCLAVRFSSRSLRGANAALLAAGSAGE